MNKLILPNRIQMNIILGYMPNTNIECLLNKQEKINVDKHVNAIKSCSKRTTNH